MLMALMSEKKTTILFDFDGTLAETMMLIHDVFNRLSGGNLPLEGTTQPQHTEMWEEQKPTPHHHPTEPSQGAVEDPEIDKIKFIIVGDSGF